MTTEDRAKRVRDAVQSPLPYYSRPLFLCFALFLFLATTEFIFTSPSYGAALTHGPVVGGVTASNANVFVRTDQASTVVIQYGTDPNLAVFSSSAPVLSSGNSDFTTIIPLIGLPSQTSIYFNILVNNVPQFSAPPYPTFATFPATSEPQDFKFVVLTDFLQVPIITTTVPTFISASRENPAFAFIGGDFDHSDPTTLDQKRTMFKRLYDVHSPYMGDFVRQILWKMPIAHQWDDHDAGANNIDKTYPYYALSQQAFQEYVPTYPLPDVSPAIWQQFHYAQADFFVLDCRTQRDPDGDADGPNKSMLDGNALGARGQLEWLKAGLLASTATWKIIFTSVPANPTVKPLDGWAQFQTEWHALRNFIEQNSIKGVLFISGDFHMGAIDNGTQSGFPEMCVGKPNAKEVSVCHSGSTAGTWSEGAMTAPCSGYGVVTILKNPDQLVLEVKEPSGTTHLSYILTQAGSDTNSPSPPANFAASATSPAHVELNWEASIDDLGVTGYVLYRNNTPLTVAGVVTNYSDVTVSPSTNYEYYARARDAAGNLSEPSNIASVTTPADNDPPTPPGNLRATPISSARVDLTWFASTDDSIVVAYDIYRNNVPLASLGPATNYSDNTTAPSTVYQYVVRARDIVGHQSDPSNPASATTPPDTVRPSTPSGFNVVAFSSKQVNLSWKASTDNVGVTGYQVYRNSAQLVSIAAVTNYADTTVSPSTSYSYKVRTFDAAGNLSSFSSTKNVTTPSKDSKAPSTPSNLVASAVSATQINLRWKASTDNRKVIGYEIYREGTLRSSIGAVTNFSDTAVLPLMTYHYQVRARDADGNLSGFSNQATASTPADAQKPSPPSQLTALATNATRVDLSWKAASDNVAVIAYDLYRDGSPLVSVGVETNYADNAVLPSTNYNYEVRARDAAGNLSDPSNTALVNTPADTDKPSAPSNLNATAVSSFQVDLAWNASTDNVAVTGYNIYRDGVSLPVTVIGTNYTDNTVLPSTNYNYEVRARDAADNLSDPSNTAPVNTPEDSGSPSAANYDPSEPVLAPTKTAISTGNGYRELVSFDQLNLEHWLAFGRHREDDS